MRDLFVFCFLISSLCCCHQAGTADVESVDSLIYMTNDIKYGDSVDVLLRKNLIAVDVKHMGDYKNYILTNNAFQGVCFDKTWTITSKIVGMEVISFRSSKSMSEIQEDWIKLTAFFNDKYGTSIRDTAYTDKSPFGISKNNELEWTNGKLLFELHSISYGNDGQLYLSISPTKEVRDSLTKRNNQQIQH